MQRSPAKRMEDREIPFTEHLEELRRRLRRSVVAVLLAFVATMSLRESLFTLLEWPMQRAVELLRTYQPDHPVRDLSMHFKDPIEPFFTYVKVALFAALFLVVPYILHEVWQFVSPGLYRHERRATVPFVVASTLMFIAGAAFCHQLVLPFGYYALLTYAGDDLIPVLMMKEYAAITIKLLLAFGVVFETPVFIIFLCRLGVVTPDQLAKYRKQALVIVAVLAAVLTPPDVVTQLLLGVPLYVLYEVSILGARLFGKPVPREDDVAASEDGAAAGDSE